MLDGEHSLVVYRSSATPGAAGPACGRRGPVRPYHRTMPLAARPTWEYAEILVVREPTPRSEWPITATVYYGDGRATSVDGDNPVVILNDLGRDGWELVGPPEVLNVVAAHVDSGGLSRDRAYWVERRFWLRRANG